MATKISYGVVINSVEDSTSDNLRGLAYLIDRASEHSMSSTLSVSGGVLTLRAEGTIDDAVAVTRSASRHAAIYPEIEAHCPACERLTLSLLEGITGVSVTAERAIGSPGEERHQMRRDDPCRPPERRPS